jgi:3-methyladenine DNA glycosylase AlkD
VPAIRTVAKQALAADRALDRDELLAVVEALWDEPVHERRMASVELLDLRSELLVPTDMALLERLIRESRTWALVDGLAASVAGSLVERFPEVGAMLDDWSTDADLWVRRSSLLALLGPIRRGSGDFARFSRYADGMLGETEFFIRKAIGWVLREAGKKQPELVYAWLLPRAQRASGLTVREAIKYLPASEQDEILAAHRTAA